MAEYDFTKSPIFASLGLRFSYQYFITNTLQKNLEREWEEGIGQYPIHLDFVASTLEHGSKLGASNTFRWSYKL